MVLLAELWIVLLQHYSQSCWPYRSWLFHGFDWYNSCGMEICQLDWMEATCRNALQSIPAGSRQSSTLVNSTVKTVFFANFFWKFWWLEVKLSEVRFNHVRSDQMLKNLKNMVNWSFEILWGFWDFWCLLESEVKKMILVNVRLMWGVIEPPKWLFTP